MSPQGHDVDEDQDGIADHEERIRERWENPFAEGALENEQPEVEPDEPAHILNCFVLGRILVHSPVKVRMAARTFSPYPGQVSSAARPCAAIPMPAMLSGCARHQQIFSAIASGERIGTRKPVSPSVIMSSAPAFFVAINGNPQAIASCCTKARPSTMEGRTKTSQLCINRRTSACGRGGS